MKSCVFIAAVGVGVVVSLPAEELSENQEAVEITAAGAVNFGSVDGFLQTPIGGAPGTSSKRRPTLNELNIRDEVFYDTRLDVRWRQLDFFSGYQFIRLDGSGRLSRSLVSNGETFAAGDPFTTHDRLDWFDIGAGWKFEFLDRRLEIMPKLELALLDFGYSLSGPGQSANRSYVKGCGRLGVESSFALNQRISLHLDGAASVPVANTPQIATVTGTINFRLLPEKHRFNPTLFVGGGAEWIDYRDSQTLPNHVHVNLGPFVTSGLSVSF